MKWIWSRLTAEIGEGWIKSLRWRRSWIVMVTSPVPGMVLVSLVWWSCFVIIVSTIIVVRVVLLLKGLIPTEVIKTLIARSKFSLCVKLGVDIIASLSSFRLVQLPDTWEGPRLLLQSLIDVNLFLAVASFCNFLTSSSRIFFLQKPGVRSFVLQHPQYLVAFCRPFWFGSIDFWFPSKAFTLCSLSSVRRFF